jgi:hypothetical protein
LVLEIVLYGLWQLCKVFVETKGESATDLVALVFSGKEVDDSIEG